MKDDLQKDLAFFILRDAARRRQLSEQLSMHRFKDAKSIYDDVRAPRSDAHGGYIALDGKVVAQTQSCGHCGAHWPIRPGSGTLRGLCRGCMRHTCGDPACDADGPNGCVTWERKMEIIESREKLRCRAGS